MQEAADSWKVAEQSRVQEAAATKLTKALKMEVNKMKYEVNDLHSELRSVKRELEQERQKNKKGWEVDGGKRSRPQTMHGLGTSSAPSTMHGMPGPLAPRAPAPRDTAQCPWMPLV